MLPAVVYYAYPFSRRGWDRHELAEQIARVDAQIDALVYELYGLTEEEIAIVEGRG